MSCYATCEVRSYHSADYVFRKTIVVIKSFYNVTEFQNSIQKFISEYYILHFLRFSIYLHIQMLWRT